MFDNLHWTNIVLLLLLALFIFGDKLPGMVADGLRLVRNLRRMAQNATGDLSRELGTEITLSDLHPKTFVRKHVLSEADQEALLRPLKDVSQDVSSQARGLEQELRDVGRRTERVGEDLKRAARPRGANGSTPAVKGPDAAEAAPPAPRQRYDDVT